MSQKQAKSPNLRALCMISGFVRLKLYAASASGPSVNVIHFKDFRELIVTRHSFFHCIFFTCQRVALRFAFE